MFPVKEQLEELKFQRKHLSSGKQQFVETGIPARLLKTRLELSAPGRWLVTQPGLPAFV